MRNFILAITVAISSAGCSNMQMATSEKRSVASTSTEKYQECKLKVVRRYLSGGQSVVKTSNTLVPSPQACFAKAIEISNSYTEEQRQGETNLNLYVATQTRYWKMIVIWNFNDGYVWDSSGEVTGYSKACMDRIGDTEPTGKKHFWKGCEVF